MNIKHNFANKNNLNCISNLKKILGCDDFALSELLVKFQKNEKKCNLKTLIINKLTYKVKNSKLLDSISFKILPNSFHVFIGENGAGKSTTIKTIIGINQNYVGEIYVKDINAYEPDIIAYVPDQQPKFPTNMTVVDYLLNTTLLLTEDTKKSILKKIKFYLNKYDLLKIYKNNVNRLSAGQKQKILLISAFLLDKQIIILDEPFANLDPTSRYKFINELKQMSQNGKSIFLSSHILEEIKEYADYATFIKNGKILFSGPIDNIDFIVNFYKNNYIDKDDNYEANF